MARLILLVLAVLLSITTSEPYNILVVFPFPSRSHSILGAGVVRHLAEAGHQITYITPFPSKNPNPRVRDIDVGSNLNLITDNVINIQGIMNKSIAMGDSTHLFKLVNTVATTTFQNPNVQNLMNDITLSFDVVVIEYMFSETYIGFSAVFGCPFIWLSSVEPHWAILRLVDEVQNPTYLPSPISGAVPPLSFKQRVEELLFLTMGYIYNEFVFYDTERELYQKIFSPVMEQRGRTLPLYDEIRFNGSLVLGNSHVSTGQATRLPQNYKPVGGYHIEADVKPLPEDLQKLMDNAKHGVIYFSMGSNLKSKDLPDEVKKSLLNMFGGLKQTVLWKFEEKLPGLPKNVHILQWAPQSSILSHANCRVFITHGGYLSTTETVHYGVPVIGIPAFADQFNNVNRAVIKGFAKKVDLAYDMADKLKDSIDDILTNPKYKEKVEELSLIYHDRPIAPGQELVHWVEHVIRTRGAPHLRSPALLVPWYQKMYLDLALTLFVVLLLVAVLFKKIIKILFKKSSPKTKSH